MRERVGLDRRVHAAELEHHQAAVEERQRGRGVLVAHGRVEGVDRLGRKARALGERRPRHQACQDEPDPPHCLSSISSTTKTSRTAMPFSGPSAGLTVISVSVLAWTSNAAEKRWPARNVRRQPRSSPGGYSLGVLAGGPIGVPRNE